LSDTNTASDLGDFAGLVGSAGPAEEPAVNPQDSTPVEAAPQETTETPASEVTPPSEPVSQPASTPEASSDDAYKSLLEDPELTESARNLIKKYQRDGEPVAKALKVAFNHAADPYWEKTRAMAAAASAEVKPEVAPPAPQAAPQTVPEPISSPDVAAFDAEVGQLLQQMKGLLAVEERAVTFKTNAEQKRAELLAEIDELTERHLTTADYEEGERLKADILKKRAQRSALDIKVREVSRDLELIDLRKQSLEGRNEILSEKKARALSAAEAKAREAERQEQLKHAAAAESAKAEQARKEAVAAAWATALPVVKAEGDPLDPEEIAAFEDSALTFYAKHPKSKSLNPSDVLEILREHKKAYDAQVELNHRKKSRIYSLKKEADVVVNAPSGKDAVAPAVRRGFGAQNEDGFTGLRAS
jgi:hypothetical protein